MKHPKGYWTFERILKEAKKYTYWKDFRQKSNKAYSAAKSKGFLPKIKEHLIYEIRKPNGYWTYDRAKAAAKKYNSRKELKKYEGYCYATIKENSWDELLDHMKLGHKPSGYWTRERILIEAKKYRTIKEFRRAEQGAYDAAHAMGIMDEVWEGKDVLGHKYKRALYVWEFDDKSAYIGLTFNYKKRHRDHKKQGPVYRKLKDTKGKFVKFNKWYKAKEAKRQEELLIEKYSNEGWTILNSAKAGSLGGGNRKWTKHHS